MQENGLVYPLLVAQTTCFHMFDVCSAKRGWTKHSSIKGHKICHVINLQGDFRLVKAAMKHMKLFLAKYRFLLRGEVDWVRTGLGSVRRLD